MRQAASSSFPRRPPARTPVRFRRAIFRACGSSASITRIFCRTEDPPFQPLEPRHSTKSVTMKKSIPTRRKALIPLRGVFTPGIPREMIQPFPWEINVMAGDRVVMIFEYQSLVRADFHRNGRGASRRHRRDIYGESACRENGRAIRWWSIRWDSTARSGSIQRGCPRPTRYTRDRTADGFGV